MKPHLLYAVGLIRLILGAVGPGFHQSDGLS